MHILLTDVLSCPRCGPEHGLVLMADRVVDRRVRDGFLGCPNCRERYGVRGGVVDLRVPGQAVLPGPESRAEPEARGEGVEAAVRLAALMGVGEGSGVALIVGRGVRHAAGVAGLVPELEVAVVGTGVEDWEEEVGVSRLLAGGGLPFRSGALGAVALTGESAVTLEAEGVRIVALGGRLVLEDAAEGAVERLREAGLAVLVDESGVVVAERA
ncbi:MAG: hypothetical protein P8099_03685 [Gemmatimonadota bacterium]